MKTMDKAKKLFISSHLYCALIWFVLAAVVLIALFCPKQVKKVYDVDGQALATITPSNINESNGVNIDENGSYTITGGDPQMIIKNVNKNLGAVVIRCKDGFTKPISVQAYLDYGKGYNETDSTTAAAFEKDKVLVVPLESKEIKNLRLDVDQNFKFNDIELYSTIPSFHYVPITISPINYAIAIIIALAVAIAVFFIDRKTKWFKAFLIIIKKNYLRILMFLGVSVLLFGIAALIEMFISWRFPSFSHYGEKFSFYRYVIICGLLIATNSVVFLRKSLGNKPENTFLALILIIGTVFIVGAPFGHNSWDVETHYRWAINSSYVGTKNYSATDVAVFNIKDFPIGKTDLITNNKAINKANELDKEITMQSSLGKTTIAHLASGAFLAVGRLFGVPFIVKFMLGEFANLLIYAFVMYFAMRKLKSGKMILAVFALFPTSLFLATNYSYDYWITCFITLGMAYFISEVQQPDKPITIKDTIIMFGAFAVGIEPKLVYLPLLLIPFFMKKNNFDEKAKKRLKIIGWTIIGLLALYTLLTAFVKIGGTGDLRGGSTVSPKGQVKYIIFNMVAYSKTLFKFLLTYLSVDTMPQYISNFAYLGITNSTIILIITAITVVTDKNEYDQNIPRKKVTILTLIIYFVIAALIATALYIVFTPVGAHSIGGCQPRYLTPIVYPVLAVIGSPFIVNKMKRSVYNGMVLCSMSAMVLYTFATVVVGTKLI